MGDILAMILPGAMMQLLLPVLRRLSSFAYLTLELQRPLDMSRDRHHYRRLGVRVRNHGTRSVEDARPHLQSFRPHGRSDALQRDEFLTWEEDQDYSIGSTGSSTRRAIEPGSGDALIAVAFARSDDNTETAELCISRRDDPDDPPMGLLLYGELSPAIATVRIVGADYSSRPLKLRLWMDDAGKNSWRTLRAERVSRARDAARALRALIAAGARSVGRAVRALGRWLRVPKRDSK